MDVFHRALEPLAAVTRHHEVGREEVVGFQLVVACVLVDAEHLESEKEALINAPLPIGHVAAATNLVDPREFDKGHQVQVFRIDGALDQSALMVADSVALSDDHFVCSVVC